MSPVRRLCSLCLLLLLAAPAFALEGVPAAEYHARRVKLAATLQGGAALIFANDEPEEEYRTWRQDEDFYYLTGWDRPGAALLIEAATEAPSARLADLSARFVAAGAPAPAHQPYREILFLPDRDFLMDVYTGAMPDAATPQITTLAGVDEVRPLSQLPAELVHLSADLNALFHLSTPSDQPKAKAAVDVMNAADGWHRTPPPVADLRSQIVPLRAVKSPGEITLLRKAADASVAAHLALLAATHDGQHERTLSGLIDYTLLENGCERPSYPSIVGSGTHATELHYAADADTLHAGDVMVVDAAGEYSMYASDVTRTMPVNGHFTPRQREIYNIVLGAQQAAIDSFVSGKSNMKSRTANDPNSLDFVAWQYINTHGKDLHGQPLGKYFTHGVGHGVGIDVHDPFDGSKPWGPGSVFTIEPGIYLPEEKIGVRIEDTFYVDPNGKLIALSGALPRSADEIEALVQKGQANGKVHATGAGAHTR